MGWFERRREKKRAKQMMDAGWVNERGNWYKRGMTSCGWCGADASYIERARTGMFDQGGYGVTCPYSQEVWHDDIINAHDELNNLLSLRHAKKSASENPVSPRIVRDALLPEIEELEREIEGATRKARELHQMHDKSDSWKYKHLVLPPGILS